VRILCLDLDGVIHTYPNGWKGATVIDGEPVEGAISFIREAVKNFHVNIYSSRSGQDGGIPAMQEWLQRYLQGDDRAVYAKLHWPTSKPAAFLTIDDRAMCFTGVWPSMEELLNFKTWQGK
jgi:hypothetical protein